MTNRQVLTQIRRHTGPIYGGVLVAHDTMFIQLVKSDLVETVAFLGKNYPDEDSSITLEVRDSFLYIHPNHDCK